MYTMWAILPGHDPSCERDVGVWIPHTPEREQNLKLQFANACNYHHILQFFMVRAFIAAKDYI